ncbi:FxSxx-COOH system tetratricopeptide repeat protein [Nocardiopsis sp. CT-R113]|uniref:FxSxx-COOH system tetratricopeptide repeat protein n=1 Tax=Nocardiopsis codii TaxID=3065942 RepID=A0ABU7KCM8_9ACTN|nr:FxSxx-COOH system tetratricopeptide repeat protein [Nocardiopsis sp. CT-R113]MEE2039674.1 FxSxx-COOH system tetratricopeptide repeat protein [Nocardiopsis sp. CT-R113]
MDDLSHRYQNALSNLTGGSSRLVVLVDSSPLMELHRDSVSELVEGAERAGCAVVRFHPGDPAHTRDEHDPPWPLHSPLPPDAAAVLVVTDTQDRGWRQPRLRTWVASLASRLPTALLHLMDRSVWSGGPLAPWPMRMTAPAPVSPSAWEFAGPVGDSEDTGLPEDVAVLPVLGFAPDSVTGWAAVVDGSVDSWEADVAVLPVDGTRPPGSAPWDPDPVSRFLSHASRGARDLAVRLAQAPVNLRVAEVIQGNIPHAARSGRAAVTEIAEVFGSELMDPTVPLGDLDDPAATALEFLPGVRRDLLGGFGDLSVMRSVFYSLGIEFKDSARIYQWLSRIESGAPLDPSLDGEENLARAVLPALSEMPGEYRRFAQHLRAALGDAPEHTAPADTAPVHATAPGVERVPDGPPRRPRTPRSQPPALLEEPSPTVTDSHITTPETAVSEPLDVGSSRLRRSRPKALAKLRGVPPHNLNFTGRERILEHVHDLLAESSGGVYLLAGGGGIGKTQIATEYVHRNRDEYDLIWWFAANSASDVQQSYLRLARYLGIGEDTGNLEQVAQQVREVLEGDPHVGRWLLVFDDVSELAQLGDDTLPANGPGDVIITSRDQSWIPSGRSEGAIVPSLSPQESVALLRKVCPQGLEDDVTALQIADRLEHLPLALAQVGAYLRDSLMSVAEFLHLLQNKFDELVTHVEPEDLYPLPLAAAWNMQLDDLRRGTGPDRALKRMVREFVQLCSFFAPRSLSRTLFHRARGLSSNPDLTQILGNEMVLTRVLRYVSRHSLAEFDRTNHTFQLHVTFQTVVQSTLSDEERVRYRDLAHRLLAQSDPLGPELPQNWPEYQLLYTHVDASEAWRSHDPQVRGLVSNVIVYLVETGNGNAALALADRAIEAWYDDTAQRFQIQLLRAKILRIRGDNEIALAEAERMYAEQAQLEGAESEEALEAHRARAIALSNLGHYARALAMFEDIHRTRTTLFSEDDENTLVIAHDIGGCLRRLGRFREALELDRRTLEQRKYVFGPDGIPTLRTRLSIGLDLMALGYLGEARETLEDCRRRFEVTEANASTHTSEIPIFLSVIHRRLGDHTLALELTEQAREVNVARYGPHAPSTLHLNSIHMVNLAFANRLDEARDLAEDLLAHMDDRFPARHLFPWASRANAAIVFRVLGEYERAHELDRAAMEAIRERFPDADVTLTAVEVNLGNDLFALGRLKEARAQDVASVELCRETLGEHHIFLTTARRNLLISRRALGEDVQGEWEALRELYASRFGPDHRFVTTMASFVRLDTDIFPVRD